MTPSRPYTPTADSIAAALSGIRSTLANATEAFEERVYGMGPYDPDDREIMAKDYLRAAFVRTLVLLDQLGLDRTYDIVNGLYTEVMKDPLKVEMFDGDPYLYWRGVLRHYVDAIGASENVQIPSTVTKDVEAILRATVHSITDRRCFAAPPADEADVHARIEAVLRCVFPDLKSKPALTKPIKNFQPDTGLPSIQTLIEYKYISTQGDAARVADEILADTRGYVSREWQRFIYVVYETHRVRPESEWNQLLRSCGLDENTNTVVLQGEPPAAAPIKRAPRKATKQ